ncbi:amidohydrolase family protein [Amycolatopsis acidiphila]|uniref:Amidohydrolase family protein n=1 Tax=Amycolatopsis acidiphila TaxID=715473 RepID=A0A557ZWS8_9PSEU|nr:amidohydrolase family protein [Amycolatopsis acidiphila]TVT16461.1 amidohydrolase family protein [Amycolatopsis acidiphila]
MGPPWWRCVSTAAGTCPRSRRSTSPRTAARSPWRGRRVSRSPRAPISRHVPHVDLLTELRLLAGAGLGDAGALAAATTEAARLLRLDHDRGRIAAGLRADLVLLAGTDLDVSDLGSRIRRVWQAGRLVTPPAAPPSPSAGRPPGAASGSP